MVKKTLKTRKPVKGKIIQSGNSLALRIPSEVAKMYGLSKGAEVSIDPEKHGFKVSPSKEDIKLDQLVSLINDRNRHEVEDWGVPEGREVW